MDFEHESQWKPHPWLPALGSARPRGLHEMIETLGALVRAG